MTRIRRGFVLIVTTPATKPESALESMLRSMLERLPGPGGGEPNLWIDAEAGVAIGIPQESETPASITLLRNLPGDIVFAASGMHGRLDGLRRNTGSGIERTSDDVLSEAVATHAPYQLFELADDPFSFVIWNGRERTATVNRDRIGHVPIFHGRVGSDFVVATHLDAFDGHPRFQGEINRNGLAGMLRYRTIPLPSTIFTGVSQLFPGTYLTIRNDSSIVRAEIGTYWSLRDQHRAAIDNRLDASADEISRELQRRLTNAIERSFTDADSPIGIFFSAGVDSNLVAAVASTTGHPIHTFTSRFDENPIDEGPDARVMAETLGATHTSLTISASQFLDTVAKAPSIYGQPHGDQAGLPAIIMADAAAEVAPLIITGDGGNDLLGSNQSLTKNFPLLSMNDSIPQRLHRPLGFVAGGASRVVEGIETAVDRFAPDSKAAKLRSSGVRRIAAILNANEPELLYGIRSSHIVTPAHYLNGRVLESPAIYFDPRRWLGGGDRYDRWRHVELSQISIEVEGSKQEGAITAAGAGYRAILLDADIPSFAFRIPDSVRYHDGVDRWPSVDIVRRIAPVGTAMPWAGGFGVPTDYWLRNELRPWAENLLSETNLRATGIFNVKTVRLEWRQHLSGFADRRYLLWPILMTLGWLENRAQRSS